MISTLAHMEESGSAQQALWTFEALAAWPEDEDGRLADILEAALTVAVRQQMEELMQTGKYEYQSEFAKRHYARGLEEGRVDGRGRALLLILRARGLLVSSTAEARITAERDEARLDAWTRRALDAKAVADIFDDG